MRVSIRPLFDLHDLVSSSAPEEISLDARMSGIESDARNDWLHVALAEYRRLKRDRGSVIGKAAFIGSANGVDVIAALRLFSIDTLIVTDIVPDIIKYIEDNIYKNTPKECLPTQIDFVCGRDCDPVANPCDVIYGNLPLLMASGDELGSDLATTTLTDAQAYSALNHGSDDPLAKWSLLSQVGFLLSAKSKLAPGGVVITLIGGRIPDEVIAECFDRAGMEYDLGTVAIMRQSDEQYLEQYAKHELRLDGKAFLFYDEAEAARLLARHGMVYPSILNLSPNDARAILEPAALTAASAWGRIQSGHHVGHLAYGFRATPRP